MATEPRLRPPAGMAQERGRSTRYKIIEQTARLCTQRPGAELSVAEIAAAAGVFPNQVTYYFGSKDSLLVHAAFLGLLHDAKEIESIGFRASDAAAFRTDISRAVLALPALPSVARALAAGISKPALAPVVQKHLDLLFRQSERYLRRLVRERGWTLDRTPAEEARTFWSAALGAVLLARAAATESVADLDLAGTLTIRDLFSPCRSLLADADHFSRREFRFGRFYHAIVWKSLRDNSKATGITRSAIPGRLRRGPHASPGACRRSVRTTARGNTPAPPQCPSRLACLQGRFGRTQAAGPFRTHPPAPH